MSLCLYCIQTDKGKVYESKKVGNRGYSYVINCLCFVKEGDLLEDLGVRRMALLKRISKEQGGRLLDGFVWLVMKQ